MTLWNYGTAAFEIKHFRVSRHTVKKEVKGKTVYEKLQLSIISPGT
jgi:hypothetical protein